MKLKLTETGAAVLADLNGAKAPVYVFDDGKELPFDAAGAVASLNSRIEQNRRLEGELADLKKVAARFKDIEDPDAARKALELVKNLDDKKLVDAGEVQRIKDETARAFQAKIEEAEAKSDKLEKRLYDEIVGGAFTRSRFIAEKLAVPSDFARAYFGDHFGVEDERLYAVDKKGNKLMSRSRPGEYADFDEAIQLLVEAHPQKDVILKASGHSGSGAGGGGGGGGNAGSKRTITRKEFDAIADPIEKARVASGKEVSIVDG